MAEVMSLKEHLVQELRDLLDAEQQLTRALPQLAQAATTPALRTAFEKHLRETERHAERLNQALGALGEAPRPKRCDGMRGLLSEGQAHLRSAPKGALRDAMLIASSQKVEHYEMAAYGTARTYAEVLGRGDLARLLSDTLSEEKAADLTLTEIAEGAVNQRAAEDWHRRGSLVEQSAEWVGHTMASATEGVRRVAKIVSARRGEVDRVTQTLSRAVDEAREAIAVPGRSSAADRKTARKRSTATGHRRTGAKRRKTPATARARKRTR